MSGGALHLRERVGGADHGAGLGHAGHDLGHERAGEPQVAKDGLVERAATGAQLGKGSLDGGREDGLAGVGGDALAGAGQQAAGVVGRGRGGVAAVGAGRDGEVHVALLGDADHGNRLGDAQGRIGRHGAALVQHQVGVDVVLSEPVDCVGAGERRHLLAVAGEVPDVARRDVALADEVLGRLEERADDALGVQRAAAPDLAVDDLGTKGVVLPVLALHGHHVLVSHHDDGVGRGVCARPAQQDAKVVDGGELAGLKGTRVEAAQRGHPLAEGLVVAQGGVLARDRGNADELAEALDGRVVRAVAVGVHWGARRRGGLQARSAGRAGGGSYAGDRDNRAQAGKNDIGSVHECSSRLHLSWGQHSREERGTRRERRLCSRTVTIAAADPPFACESGRWEPSQRPKAHANRGEKGETGQECPFYLAINNVPSVRRGARGSPGGRRGRQRRRRG